MLELILFIIGGIIIVILWLYFVCWGIAYGLDAKYKDIDNELFKEFKENDSENIQHDSQTADGFGKPTKSDLQ